MIRNLDTFGNKAICDCFTWPWRDIPHGTANFGHEPRPTLNITGAVTDRTLEVLKNFPKTFNVDEL